MENQFTLNFEKGDGAFTSNYSGCYHTKSTNARIYESRKRSKKTCTEKRVTFFSRTKNQLWQKGETSGNFLEVVSIKEDCDQDTLLIQVIPAGPVCHTGSDTCFKETNESADFLSHLEKIIRDRKTNPSSTSYTSSLSSKRGLIKIAQKVGEEAVELVIEAKDDNKDLFLNEAADLMFHFLVLLAEKGYRLEEVIDMLRKRH